MPRILICFLIPLVIMFAGLIPAYSWAIPLAIGGVLTMIILKWVDLSDQKYI